MAKPKRNQNDFGSPSSPLLSGRRLQKSLLDKQRLNRRQKKEASHSLIRQPVIHRKC